MPQVSIGMPVFNDKKFLQKAVDSLLSQTFSDFELIISDDCSSDGSAEICLAYAAHDSRIRYIRQHSNIGISKNMKFLLNEAKGKYFMWAANDDIWHGEFLETLIRGFDNRPDMIVAFCPVRFIDEKERQIENVPDRYTDYSGTTSLVRLNKLINIFDDAFGYGLFRREMIMEVEFPTWWWVNRTCAYNNIYPTLCYYLTKGDYILMGKQPLWFNRLKEEANINHKVPYGNTYLRGTLAFCLRKFNLFWISCRQIRRGGGSAGLLIRILPGIFYKWFLKPSLINFKVQTRQYRMGNLKFL
jgi:glycosyltransferase involved in cell wall biosynthesis